VGSWDEKKLNEDDSLATADSLTPRAFFGSTLNETHACVGGTFTHLCLRAAFTCCTTADVVGSSLLFAGYSGPATAVTEDPDDWEEEDDSAEADDDGRVYKNPRNFPSPGLLFLFGF
jgi:hypothetical protein